jgi:hypothetical protein
MTVIAQFMAFWGVTPCILVAHTNIWGEYAVSTFSVEVCEVKSSKEGGCLDSWEVDDVELAPAQ